VREHGEEAVEDVFPDHTQTYVRGFSRADGVESDSSESDSTESNSEVPTAGSGKTDAK